MYVDGNTPSQFEFVVRKIHDLSDGNCDTLSISPTIAIPLLIVMAFDYGDHNAALPGMVYWGKGAD